MEIKRIEYDFSVFKVADYSCVNLDAEYCFVGKTDEEKSLEGLFPWGILFAMTVWNIRTATQKCPIIWCLSCLQMLIA